MTRGLKVGSVGYCLHCGFRIEVVAVSTGRFISGPFWRNEWHHVYQGSNHDWGKHCHGAPVATPKPHRKRASGTSKVGGES